MDEENRLGVADAIDGLRRELSEAVARGEREAVRFELGAVTLEFEIAVTTAVEGKVGVQFWVVSASAGADRSTARTHRLKVELSPVIDGRRNPLISGRHPKGE